MLNKKSLTELLLIPCKVFFSVKSPSPVNVRKYCSIAIDWDDTSLGIILSSRILISSLKKKIPDQKITLFVNSKYLNFLNNKNIKTLFGLSENDIIIANNRILKKLSGKYDYIILPSLTEFSFKSHLIARLRRFGQSIGYNLINNIPNPFNFMLNDKFDLNWDQNPDSHFAELMLVLFENFGITEKDIFSEIFTYKLSDYEKNNLIDNFGIDAQKKIITICLETDQPSQKWDSKNILGLFWKLKENWDFYFYFIGSKIEEELKLIPNYKMYCKLIETNNYFDTLKIIAVSDLFITNNYEKMHLGGITSVPQISLFGSNNPYRWAPVGKNKKFAKVSEIVNDISPEQVFSMTETLLKK